jgi:hypothetical protein
VKVHGVPQPRRPLLATPSLTLARWHAWSGE